MRLPKVWVASIKTRSITRLKFCQKTWSSMYCPKLPEVFGSLRAGIR
jgi:hypothetical protein